MEGPDPAALAAAEFQGRRLARIAGLLAHRHVDLESLQL
jgi:hypothetical protein